MEIPADYRRYPLTKPLIVNDYEFEEVVISPHYEENHSSYMNDDKILKIVQHLNNKTFDVYHAGTTELGNEWQNFFYEPFFHEDKPHRLVWYWEVGDSQLLIINCHRIEVKKNYINKSYEK